MSEAKSETILIHKVPKEIRILWENLAARDNMTLSDYIKQFLIDVGPELIASYKDPSAY